MEMDEPPIDLSALDPTRDRDPWEHRVAALTAAAHPELARRAVAASPVQVLANWFRPALALAALLALCAGLGLVLLGPGEAPDEPAAAEALRLPSPVGLWLGEKRPPTLDEVVVAMRGGRP
jgi:hypothetical protein